MRQCFNCQFFGHSSNYCGKPPRCVKCDQPHATKDCTKPLAHHQNVSTAAVNTQPTSQDAPGTSNNFTTTPRLPINICNKRANQNLIHPHSNTNNPHFHHSGPHPRPLHTWAQITAQTPHISNQQPLSSTFDSIKSILSMFNFHKLSTQLRSIALQLQESKDPITKIVAIMDTVVGCLSSSP